MITRFSCGSRRSKGVPSSSGVILRFLVGELGTPKFPKVSPMANDYMYTHTECNCTARQIWTKDVWKRAILMTDVFFHQVSSPLPIKSSPNPILGEHFNANLLYRELSVSARKWSYEAETLQLYRYRQVLRGVSYFFPLGVGRPGAQGPLM